MKIIKAIGIIYLLIMAWTIGHVVDTRRAEQEGRACGTFVC